MPPIPPPPLVALVASPVVTASPVVAPVVITWLGKKSSVTAVLPGVGVTVTSARVFVSPLSSRSAPSTNGSPSDPVSSPANVSEPFSQAAVSCWWRPGSLVALIVTLTVMPPRAMHSAALAAFPSKVQVTTTSVGPSGGVPLLSEPFPQ